MENSWVAVEACTLPTVERPVRAAEFDSLFAELVEEVARVSATRLVLRLGGGEGVAERAQGLAERETACCSFFTFRVVDEAEAGVRLEVEVPRERVAILAGLAARAEASLHGRAS